MEVGHRGQSVDLEILVRSEASGVLDWSPVGEGGLGIVEPLVAHVLD